MPLDPKELMSIRNSNRGGTRSAGSSRRPPPSPQYEEPEEMFRDRRRMRQVVQDYDDEFIDDDQVQGGDDEGEWVPPVKKQKRGLFRRRASPSVEKPAGRLGDRFMLVLIFGMTLLSFIIAFWQALSGKTSTDFAYSIKFVHILLAVNSVQMLIVYLSLHLTISTRK